VLCEGVTANLDTSTKPSWHSLGSNNRPAADHGYVATYQDDTDDHKRWSLTGPAGAWLS